MPWEPDRYHQFQKERAAPFDDLLSLVRPRAGLKVIDLGCGTGELTQKLAGFLPESQVVGLDSSTSMLERARSLERPGLRFEYGQIEDLGEDWDLIFSNAALQWVEDHPALFKRLFERARPDGQLVVQMPSNHHHPTHTLILETAAEEPFQTALQGWVRHSPVLSIEAYAELLHACGANELVVFEKVYPHVLADAEALADWASGTALVPYFERLGPELKQAFLERYRQRLRVSWPESPVFYGFRRILIAAHKPQSG